MVSVDVKHHVYLWSSWSLCQGHIRFLLQHGQTFLKLRLLFQTININPNQPQEWDIIIMHCSATCLFFFILNPFSADYLLTVIMQFPNFPRPCPKMPFSPYFAGTSVSENLQKFSLHKNSPKAREIKTHTQINTKKKITFLIFSLDITLQFTNLKQIHISKGTSHNDKQQPSSEWHTTDWWEHLTTTNSQQNDTQQTRGNNSSPQKDTQQICGNNSNPQNDAQQTDGNISQLQTANRMTHNRPVGTTAALRRTHNRPVETSRNYKGRKGHTTDQREHLRTIKAEKDTQQSSGNISGL